MQSKGGAPENGSLVQTIPKVGNPIISQVPRNRPGPTPLQAVILVVNLPDVTKGCDIKPIEAIEMFVILLLWGLKPLLSSPASHATGTTYLNFK